MKKHNRKIITLLTAAALLIAAFMTGCTKLSEAPNTTSTEVDVPAESDGFGMYVKLEVDNANSLYLHGGSFTKVCENADGSPVLTLPILDEIDADVTVGTSGSSLTAVRAAADLLDWGVNTGLGTDEIGDAASTWLAAKNNDLADCLHKLELVDDACRKLLTDEARELLDSAGCEDMVITWGSEPVEPVEAIMQAAGLRG